MNFEIQTKNGICIIVILVIILCILYVLSCIKIKKTKNINCNCSMMKDDIPSYKIKNINENYTNNKKNKLSLCFTEWCGHSRNFLPEWKKIKNEIESKKELNTICVEYNCEEDKKTCEKYNVRGYPTLLLHKENGEVINYNGQREMSEIIKFVKQNIN